MNNDPLVTKNRLHKNRVFEPKLIRQSEFYYVITADCPFVDDLSSSERAS